MFVMVYLVNNINTEWRITFQHFNLAMVAMLVDLIMQYWIGTLKDEESDKKPFILILAIELLLAIVGLFVCWLSNWHLYRNRRLHLWLFIAIIDV